MSDAFVKLSRPSIATGEKGVEEYTTIAVYKTEMPDAPERNSILVVAINHNNGRQPCHIEVPIEDIPALIDALQRFRTG